MNLTSLTPRFSHRILSEALEDSPVVLIHGPRQCGKSTLARMLGDALGYDYMTFDNDVTRDFALNDPIGFIDGLPERVILDEVQRVPQLFTSLKGAVDKDRQPGRFLLTGSANKDLRGVAEMFGTVTISIRSCNVMCVKFQTSARSMRCRVCCGSQLLVRRSC